MKDAAIIKLVSIPCGTAIVITALILDGPTVFVTAMAVACALLGVGGYAAATLRKG